MFGIDQMLVDLLGDNPALFIIAGFSTLIILNLIVSLILAFRSKDDDIDFNILPDFIQPIILYSIFILAMEALLIISVGIPAFRTIFMSIELIGIAAIATKYLSQIYSKLKQLGMKIDKKADKIIEEKIALTVPELDENVLIVSSFNEEDESYLSGRDDEDYR